MDYEVIINEYSDDDLFSFSIYIEKDGEEIGFLKASYWKKDKDLMIEDIDTVKDLRRQGLGKLRLKEMLKLLDEKRYQIERIITDGLGSYAHTREIAENFFRKFGFSSICEDELGGNWAVDPEELRKRLEMN